MSIKFFDIYDLLPNREGKCQQKKYNHQEIKGKWSDNGRPKAQKPDNWNEVITQWHNDDITAVKAMERGTYWAKEKHLL